jgi:hypothetical protein
MNRSFLVVATCLLVAAFSLSGCKMVTLKESQPEKPCINVADYPDSVILQKIQDPCKVYRILASVPKMAIALDYYTYADFHNKAVHWINTLRLASSVSAKAVKDVMLVEIGKVNKKVGAVAFILSDTMLAFDDEVVFGSDDIKILIMAIQGVDEQAKMMSMFQ